MAQQVAADRAKFRRVKETLSICRRDVRKLISAAMEEGAAGDWETVEAMYIDLVGRIPRTPVIGDLQAILEEMEMLQSEILNLLEMQMITKKRTPMMSGLTATYRIQIPNPSMNLNLALKKSRERNLRQNRSRSGSR